MKGFIMAKSTTDDYEFMLANVWSYIPTSRYRNMSVADIEATEKSLREQLENEMLGVYPVRGFGVIMGYENVVKGEPTTDGGTNDE